MPGTNPWTNIKDLSIQVYDGTDGKTTLADETFIYANNKHTAIIVISFKAIDANDNDINSSDLPTADRLRSSIKLLDYNTGLNLEVNEPWAVVTKLDAFTAPIGAADGGKTLTGNTAQLVGNAYTFKFFVKTDAPDFSGINNVKDVDIGVEIDISKLVAGGGSIFKSCIGGDFLESCTIHAIRKYALPKEILTQEIVTVNCENNGTPEDDSSQLSQDHYYREIHFAYHFDLSEAEDDFQYNNKICRAEISLKDPPYTPTQQSSLDTNEDDPTGGSAANSALEPCCFLDRRDGLYSYKAYLWPACLMNMANSTKLEPETLIPERGILQEYNLYKDGFEKNTVNLSTLFTNNKNFKFATDTVIYISVYLTFGYMAQHYARGTYYKLNIVDQYGNILKVETDPAACPQIFSPDEDSDQNGLHKFTDIENPPQWLSVPTDDKIRYYNIGDPKNLYFWLVSGGQNSNSILTYNYKTTGSNEIDSLNFIPVSDYNNITFTPTLQAGFQTYRLLNDKTEIQNAQYKLAFYDNGLSQTATLGITQGNHSYVLQTLPIYEIDSQYTIEWQFCPVWENGTFIMWGNKLPDFNRQRTTLMTSDTSPYYDIGAPSMGFEVAEFAALPAHRIEDGVVKNELLDGKFDTGSNGPKDPFAASGTNTARGDWASVNAVIMTWTQTDYSGLSIYRNGHHRGEIWLTFNAQNLKDGSITGNCNQPPKPKFVQNSIDIVDYETGQSITSLNEGWRYEVFVQDPNDPNDVNPYKKYTSAIRQGEFGIITSHLNPDAGKPYNFNVYIYIYLITLQIHFQKTER
ncbi:hypothetical protein [Brucella pseudogrignonensis]|uniref:hypothetical protein n=1 Tax=Brucella pseudogrignonensis TaxID=419475 RepID=UPI003D965356